MDRSGDLVQCNISKILTACCQITSTQSLDYRANSYHIHLSTLGFHGCGEEISQICPCPFCPINTPFFGTPSPPCHSIAPKSTFTAAALPEDSNNFNKGLSSPTPKSSICEEMAINFIVPEVSLPPFLLHFYCTPVHPQFVLLNICFPFCSFYPQKLLGFGIRSLFLPINLTSNVLAH